jgi:hypothetical protein
VQQDARGDARAAVGHGSPPAAPAARRSTGVERTGDPPRHAIDRVGSPASARAGGVDDDGPAAPPARPGDRRRPARPGRTLAARLPPAAQRRRSPGSRGRAPRTTLVAEVAQEPQALGAERAVVATTCTPGPIPARRPQSCELPGVRSGRPRRARSELRDLPHRGTRRPGCGLEIEPLAQVGSSSDQRQSTNW